MRSGEFMHTLPEAVRPHLPPELRDFQWQARTWLVQFYYGDSRIHYEVWWLGEQRGKRLELGLHFESRDHALNQHLLERFLAHLFEIKVELGPQVEAEMWDRGWTKVYEVYPFDGFNRETLDAVAARMAQVITGLQPILEAEISSQ